MMEPRAFPPPRPLVHAALWAVAGVLATRYGGLPGLVLAVTAVLLLRAQGRGPRASLALVPAALAALVPATAGPPSPPPGPALLRGVVGRQVDVDPHAGETRFELGTPGGTVRCTAEGTPPLLPGDRVAAHARIKTPARDGTARAVVPAGALEVEAGGSHPLRPAVALRLAMQERLLEWVPGRAGDLLCHLALGRGPRLDDDVVTAHRTTGLTHLLAVSGAHASMLAWMLGLLWGAGGRSPLGRAGYRWTCSVILVVYAALTGLEAPVFRALVAFLVLLLGHGAGRRVDTAAVLALPALLTAWLDPDRLGSASFCLSYAAVGGLVLAGTFRGEGILRSWWRTALVASAWATLTTAPLTLWWFGQLAPWTVLATPLLAPLVAALLAGSLLCALGDLLLPGCGALFAPWLHAATELYLLAVEACAALPGTPILAPCRPGPWVLVLAAATGGVLGLAVGGRRGVAVLCLALVVPHFLPAPAPPERLRLLDVGHGQACLLEGTTAGTVLVDCGNLGRGHAAVRATVDALEPRRVVDLLVLTHGDADHVGGVTGLLQRVPVRRLVAAAPLRRHPVVADAAVRIGDVVWVPPGVVTGLAPGLRAWVPDLPHRGPNDRSLWLEVSWSGRRALLCGDAQEPGVAAALDGGFVRPADVLVLPHHGRGLRLIDELLDRVRPGAALVSCAGDALPTEQGRAARRRGIAVWATGAAGTVTVTMAPPAVSGSEPVPLPPRPAGRDTTGPSPSRSSGPARGSR